MEGYEVEAVPFYFNYDTSVALFRGFSHTRNRLPVVIKRHDFNLITEKSVQVQMVQVINAAVAQAKVQHPNACDILEVQLEMERTNCSIYHVLESLETDLRQEIEMRRETRNPFEEGELRQVLLQIASVLTEAHHKKIAHRNVKPSNILKTANNYKLGDFGCVHMSRDTSVSKGAAGDMHYWSPQLREACMRGTPYNVFKADVFALGASILHMATLTSPEPVIAADSLEEAVSREVDALSCSALLQSLLKKMLSYQESFRPTMKEVCAALSQAEEFKMPQQLQRPKQATELIPTTLTGVYRNTAFTYEIQSQQLSKHTLSSNFGSGGSFLQADRHALLCVGSKPASSTVYSLALPSFQFSRLPSLSAPRSSPGLAKKKSRLYVFGGLNEAGKCLSSCEKLSDQRWSQSSSMRYPRSSFTPCHFHSLLYLSSANREAQRTVETFNAETETFALLPVSLPPQLNIGENSVAFIANGELCLLTQSKQMVCWSIETEREFRLYHIDRQSWSGQHPLIVGAVVLIACEGAIQKFSMETYSFLA